jgi:hypothetical protein
MAHTYGISAGAGSVWIRYLLTDPWGETAHEADAANQEEATLIWFGSRQVVSILIVAAGVSLPSATYAGTDGGSSASIGISPVYQNVSIAAHQPSSHYVVTLSNGTGTDQAFKLSVVDFGSLNESGGVAFLGTSSSTFAQKYGLSKWLSLDQNALTVPAGESVQIGVTVTNSESLSPGGHYGAILATALTAPNGPPVGPRVGVLEVLSSLLLLVKGGGPLPDLRLVSQSVDAQGLHMPSQVEDRFQNAGDVHVVPRGVVEVRDPFGRLVERAALNEDSGIILPQTFRRYEAPLMQLATVWTPGRYSVVTTYRYDGTQTTKVFSSSFWYIGSVKTWAALLVAVVIFASGLWWFRRKRKTSRAGRSR